MGKKETVEALVKGGQATAAPPLGPALSPLKVNVGQVVAEINERTKIFNGMEVPVKIFVDTETKKFTVAVGTPPVTSMIKKELNAQKLGRTVEGVKGPGGDLPFSAVVKIAKSKDSISGSVKSKVKQVLGTCLSGNVTVDGKNPRLVQKEVDEGRHDDLLG